VIVLLVLMAVGVAADVLGQQTDHIRGESLVYHLYCHSPGSCLYRALFLLAFLAVFCGPILCEGANADPLFAAHNRTDFNPDFSVSPQAGAPF
jgi:hypothetical protein